MENLKIIKPALLLTGAVLAIFFMSCRKKDNTPDPVTDIDGNVYKTIRIGDQVWMAENLKTTLFSDGSTIAYFPAGDEWAGLISAGYCWYNNDISNKSVSGALYNYYAAVSGMLCPDGWHMPSDAEWRQLRDFTGDTLTGGGKLKEEGTEHWSIPNTGSVNSTGFTALPAGIRYFEGTFSSASFFTSFWSSTESDDSRSWYFSLYYNDAVAAMNKTSKKDGFSIRCIKD